MIYEAVVTEVLPRVAGVRVRFRDLVPTGFALNDYVLVLQPRMSDSGGALLWLPEVGEHGVVARLTGGVYVWLGSLPFLDKNQVDPARDLYLLRHQSGVTAQIRRNGDFEIAHPSGFRITVGHSSAALPVPQRTSNVDALGGGVPTLQIAHPAGASFTINEDGEVTLTASKITMIAADVECRAGTTVHVVSPTINLDGNVYCQGILFVNGGFSSNHSGGRIPGDVRIDGSLYAYTDGFFGPTAKSFLLHTHYTNGLSGQTAKPT